MSREQYRARSKKVQKLGRDGLVEQDKATGQEKRISQRAADVSFGPERPLEQATGRASSQRTPAQGGRRKQPRPSPPPEPVQPIAGDVPVVTEIAPSTRQADDVPMTAPPPKSEDRSSAKRRQQKRANRLHPDTPAHPGTENGADGGRLQFEPGDNPTVDAASASAANSEPMREKIELVTPRGAADIPLRERPPDKRTPPPTHHRIEGGGRLRFEPEHDPPSDTVSADAANSEPLREDTEPIAPRGVSDIPIRERPSDRRIPSQTHRRAEGGGRLRFEPEPPTAADTPNRERPPEESTPAALRGVDDVPMREWHSAKHRPLPPRHLAEGGGRLQFEPGHDPPSDTASADAANSEPLSEKSEPVAPRGVSDIPKREGPSDRRIPSQTHRRAEGGGRLRFEPEPPTTADTPNRERTPEESTPAAPRGVADVPMRERHSTRHIPRPTQRRAEGGGRLQFEPERHQPPAVTDTRTRRVVEANAPAAPQSHGDTPTPEYERKSLPKHEGASVSESASDPSAGLTRRQRKRYEKVEHRVEQSGHKLEKAQAKLPTRRRAHLQKEYDANTGKVRRRLRFETEVEPEVVKPSIPAQVGRTVKSAAVMKLHSKIRENERDNTAVEAAHKGELAAEQGAGRFLRWNKQRLRSKPYRAVRQAEHRLNTDQTKLAWQIALRDNPELRRKNALAKLVQKQKIKRKYAQAAREAQKTAQHTQQVLTASGKIVRAVQQFAAAHKSALLIVALLALVVAFFSAGLASCTAMLSGVQSSFLSATYLADEQEISNSELYFTELETNLQLDIASTETNYPGYDEYRYNIGDISHNPYELMSYLSAVYGAFTFEQVRPEIEHLFGEKYQLTRTPITETRYDEDGEPYEWTVLQTTLTVGRLGDTITASFTTGDQADLYGEYMRANGNRQAFGNPFDFPWLGYVSSGYGWRVHPTTGAKDLHRGVDIAVAQGTAITAIQDGRIISAGNMGSYGLCVVIEDDKGYQSRYAHCSSLNVSAGQEVKRGDVIGAVGNTGNSTGPHLHLEVMLDGEYLDPRYFVDTGNSGSGGALPGEPGEPVIPDNPGAAMGGDRFQTMLTEAEKYLGYPYVWGGASPATSFDCSGYVSWVINHSGWNYGRLGVMGLEDVCTPVSAANAQPGDLVFFIGTYDAPYPNRPTHVGIYVGGGRFIHCGNPISYANLSSTYWVNHFYGFGRLPGP